MATLLVQTPPVRNSCTPPPPGAAGLTLDASKFKSTPVPNKHIPFCSPGPAPSQARTLVTPPSSPQSSQSLPDRPSLLHPVNDYEQISTDPAIYTIDAPALNAALDHIATNPLPNPSHVFPWLHGLHPDNQVQQAYFVARRKTARRVPAGLRGITIVKAGSDLCKSKIRGAITPTEVLAPTGLRDSRFADVDPREGFSVRNFHIQVAKLALCSDVVVYKDDETKEAELRLTAQKFARAQRHQWERCVANGSEASEYNTFVLKGMLSNSRWQAEGTKADQNNSGSFADLQNSYPELIAIDSQGQPTGSVTDFCEPMSLFAWLSC